MGETNIDILKFKGSPNFAQKKNTENNLPVASDKFLSMTAREIQVPITTLSWNTERLVKVLGETANNPDVAKILKRINEANSRLITLAEDLLNVAKMQEGAFLVAKRPMQLVEVIRRALRSNEREALKRGVTVKWSADASQIPLTLGDPERMHQVVLNILSNAVKYTPRGGTVTVTVRKSTELAPVNISAGIKTNHVGSEYVLCSVEDTGIGISKEEQKEVFTQFFRSRKAVASDEGGTGLGLFLVKKIVEQHEGAIWFTSREGYGTTFFFTVPVLNPYETDAKNINN